MRPSHGNTGSCQNPSKEDTSVLYTPAGVFVEVVVAIPVAQLPAKVTAYVHAQYGKFPVGRLKKRPQEGPFL